MSYEQDQMSGSYDEDDDCLSLNADNEFVPTSPPEGPTMHSPQALMQPKQAQQQQQQPLLMTTTDAPVQLPQIFAYSGPTEVVLFPGEYRHNVYRFMDARDGFNYMAVPITSSENFLIS